MDDPVAPSGSPRARPGSSPARPAGARWRCPARRSLSAMRAKARSRRDRPGPGDSAWAASSQSWGGTMFMTSQRTRPAFGIPQHGGMLPALAPGRASSASVQPIATSPSLIHASINPNPNFRDQWPIHLDRRKPSSRLTEPSFNHPPDINDTTFGRRMCKEYCQ